MLVEHEFWDDSTKKRIYPRKYIFTYMLRGTKEQRKLIEDFAKEKELDIVTIPFLDYEKIELYDFKFGDYKLWDADPLEFVSAVRHAEYVFCDSFHCIVFSILYHKDFFVFPKIGNNGLIKETQLSRMVDLLDLVGITNRILNNKLPEMQSTIDWNKVDKVIADERIKSRNYLKNELLR